MKSLGIIIVAYNSEDELERCIDAVIASSKVTNIKSTVVVVDNNSKDGSVKVSEQSGAHVIANKQNGGFAKAVNQGITEALAGGAYYILILNPDAVVEKDSLAAMIQTLDSDMKFGAVGPNMVNKKGDPTAEGYYQKAPSLLSVLLFSTVLRKYFIHRPFFVNRYYQETGLLHSREVEQIPGACLLTSRDVLRDVGFLDEDFAIWFEDVEWCYRARKKGYKMYYDSKARILHEGGVSFEQWQSLDKAVTFYVSMKTFFKKEKPVSGIFVIAVICLNSLFLTLKNRDSSNLVFVKKFIKQKKGLLPR